MISISKKWRFSFGTADNLERKVSPEEYVTFHYRIWEWQSFPFYRTERKGTLGLQCKAPGKILNLLRRLLPTPPENLCSTVRHLTGFTKGDILPTYIIRTKQIIFKQTNFSSSRTWLASHFNSVDLLWSVWKVNWSILCCWLKMEHAA